MRVLYIASADYKYGASKSMMSLMLYLRNHYDIEPILLTKQHNKLNDICNEKGIENYSCWYCDFMSGSPYSFFPMKIAKHIVKYTLYIAGSFWQYKVLTCGIDFNTIDIIHSNHSRLQIGAYISSKKNIPHVWHIREFGKDYNVTFYKPNTIRYMNQHADKFIAISNAVRQNWIDQGLNSEKIVTIYNGLETEGYVPKKNRNDNILKLVIVGRIQKSKGQLQLVKAVSMLPENIRSHVQVDIIGEGYKDYLYQINKIIKNNHLDNIHYVGYHQNIPEKLSEYDVGVICSKAEGFGRVTVEYMLAGLYVVATKSGANPELIKSREQGMLYEDDNICELSKCIEELYVHRKQYCGNVDYNDLFSMEAYASGVYAVYNRIIIEEKKT